jgi:ubiquinol-cytochrome c reductase cytochrome c subunit
MRTVRVHLLLAVAVLAGLLVPIRRADASPPASEIAAGRNLYGQYCAACHATATQAAEAGLIGAGPLREQDVKRAIAPSLAGVGALAADFYLRTGYMPLAQMGGEPHRQRVLFSDPQIRQIVAYVASLGPGPPIPSPHPERGSLAQGMQLFTSHCAGCHQVAGVGGYVSGAVAPPLGSATPQQIAEAVRIGPYVMPRFSETAISNAQLDSIIAYVRYAKHPDDRGGLAIGHLGPVPEGLVTWLIAAVALISVCVIIGKRLPRAG